MDLSGKVLLGRVARPHGLKGQLKIVLSKEIKELLQPEALFILENNSLIPYFIRDMEKRGSAEYLIGFEDINNPELARSLSGKEVYVSPDQVQLEQANGLDELVGYDLLDETGQQVGKITAVHEFPAQPMLEVQAADNEELLIPLVEEWVLGIDQQAHQIQMELPDGLTEAQDG